MADMKIQFMAAAITGMLAAEPPFRGLSDADVEERQDAIIKRAYDIADKVCTLYEKKFRKDQEKGMKIKPMT